MSNPCPVRMFPAPLLTLKGFLSLAAGFCIPVLGMLASVRLEVLLFMLGLFLAGHLLFIAVDYLQTRALLRGTRVLPGIRSRLHSGLKAEFTIVVNISGAPRRTHLRFRPEVQEGIEALDEIQELVVPRGDSAAVLGFHVRPTSRGPRVWRYADVRARAWHGLFVWQAQISFEPAFTATVFPNDASSERRGLQAFQRHLSGELSVERRWSEGREFDSLRLYSHGDDLRKIDWKRSAKGRRLLYKVYRPETHQRINIAIDCSRRMLNHVDHRMQIEFAADGAAHLLKLANHTEDEIGFFAFHTEVVRSIACRRGNKQEQLIIDALTELEVSSFEPDYQLLSEWAAMNHRRSLLILITSISNPVGVDAIAQVLLPAKRRHLPLVFAIADQDLEQLILQRAGNLSDAYTIAAAMEQMEQIQLRIHQLRRAGVECIYCSAARLQAAMRNKYLELKSLGRL